MVGSLFKVLLFKYTMFLIPDIKMLECYVDTSLINMHKDSSEGHGHPPNVPDQAISSRLLPQNVIHAFQQKVLRRYSILGKPIFHYSPLRKYKYLPPFRYTLWVELISHRK